MCVKDVVVQNQVGLHARPATFFIQKANEFKSSIWVETVSYTHLDVYKRQLLYRAAYLAAMLRDCFCSMLLLCHSVLKHRAVYAQR